MPQMMPLTWLMYFPFVFLIINITFIMIYQNFYFPKMEIQIPKFYKLHFGMVW